MVVVAGAAKKDTVISGVFNVGNSFARKLLGSRLPDQSVLFHAVKYQGGIYGTFSCNIRRIIGRGLYRIQKLIGVGIKQVSFQVVGLILTFVRIYFNPDLMRKGFLIL